MREEPDNTTSPMTLKTIPKESVVKKKLSAKDYLSRKKSTSPTEAEAPGKPDARQNNGTDAKRTS